MLESKTVGTLNSFFFDKLESGIECAAAVVPAHPQFVVVVVVVVVASLFVVSFIFLPQLTHIVSSL